MTPLGQHFTPLAMAREIVARHGIVDAWLDGATVCDPTAGEGAFLEALVVEALSRGVPANVLPMDRLVGIERDAAVAARIAPRIASHVGATISQARVVVRDVFDCDSAVEADVLVGNPPWCTYVDLPEGERMRLRPLFHACGLVGDSRRLLLGGSRVDVAALVIAWSIRHLLRPSGRAVFVAPLSLYLNDGAHDAFRHHRVDGAPYALESVWDHRAAPVFADVSTRHGVVAYRRDVEARYPVPWHEHSDDGWVVREASPVDGHYGPLRVGTDAGVATAATKPFVDPAWRPRQGANACGATDVFVFDACRSEGDHVLVSNAAVGTVPLPRRFVRPLMSRETFGSSADPPRRFLLVPHDEVTGRPLDAAAVAREPLLARYLAEHEERLRDRKGTLIQGHIRRGAWWALLGIGPYAFSPWRVAWEALGRSTFRPVLLGRTDLGPWQGNQAQHAYIPVADRAEGERVLRALAPEIVEPLLRSHRMEGTRNWAQPGRIARILQNQYG